MTKRAGVIGHPVGHSISPSVYGAAFKAAGIDATYEAWDTPPDTLEGRVNALRGSDFYGANVTIPHKVAIGQFLDGMSDVATKSGAVNAVVHDGDRLIGDNTDVTGFARSLREDAGFDAKGKRAMLLGSGGAARAVALALIEAHASVVYVVGRQPKKIDRLVLDLKPLTPTGTTVSWAYWGDGSYLNMLGGEADLVVNCTPVGMSETDTAGESPVPADLMQPKTLFFDLVYNPVETPFVAAAKSRGARACSGMGMLVYQAAETFKLWTGQTADTNAMFAAARTSLGA
ncbi:MAG: shikimate dehydrogenase [Dehalococcoidia bacterium]